MESWKAVRGFEAYEVSDLGNVRRNGKTLRQFGNGCGYFKVNLSDRGRRESRYVHRLVADAFVDNPNDLNVVNHLDEDKTNNRADNLEWTTSYGNLHYGHAIEKMSESLKRNIGSRNKSSIRILCVELERVFFGSYEAERLTGTSQSNIIQCCKGVRKSAGGYHWKYN